ncbi:MAG: fumarylacetoacetate hydrolase family protein [Egibacteraceae bacterium]
MRIVRVTRPDGPCFGVVQGEHVILIDGHPFGELTLTDQIAPLEKVRLLAPVIPSKILCAGQNYATHAAELGHEVPSEPLIFSKPSTSVIGPVDGIRLPALSERVDHEAELAVVIGRLTRKVAVADALDAVLGYTCANDVTARDLQLRDGQWTRAKGFDTFCPLGPWIETELDVAAGLGVRCLVNGAVRQDGSTADLIFDVPTLVSYCAAFTTLLPGDVILTGTPAGVGPIVAGDEVEVEVEGIGTLSNPVVVDV